MCHRGLGHSNALNYNIFDTSTIPTYSMSSQKDIGATIVAHALPRWYDWNLVFMYVPHSTRSLSHAESLTARPKIEACLIKFARLSRNVATLLAPCQRNAGYLATKI